MERAHDLAQRRHLGDLELPLEVVESEPHVARGLVPDDLAGQGAPQGVQSGQDDVLLGVLHIDEPGSEGDQGARIAGQGRIAGGDLAHLTNAR